MASVFRRKTMTKSLLPHNQFIERIRKSLYFGNDSLTNELEISRPLADYSAELFSEAHRGHSLNRLHSVAAGSLRATPCSLLMALIYLDRMNATDPGFLRRITPQELFIVSMMISTKLHIGYDEEIYISDWAKEGQISEKQLKRLELDFLKAIEWNIYISNEQFFEKLQLVENKLARREGLKRGWLTYTELAQLLPSLALAKYLLRNLTFLTVSYTAGIITLASAVLMANQISTVNKDLLTKRNELDTLVKTQQLDENSVIYTPADKIKICAKIAESAINTDYKPIATDFKLNLTDQVDRNKPAYTLWDLLNLYKSTKSAFIFKHFKEFNTNYNPICNKTNLLWEKENQIYSKQTFGCHCSSNNPSKNCLLWHIFSDIAINSLEFLPKF